MVDDGSKDNTAEAIAQFADERIHYHAKWNGKRGKVRNISEYYSKPAPRSRMSLVREAAESLKRPVRPFKRTLFDRMGWKQVLPIATVEELGTGYTAREGEEPLDAVYRVCDEFMDRYNASHPVEFWHKGSSTMHKVFQET